MSCRRLQSSAFRGFTKEGLEDLREVLRAAKAEAQAKAEDNKRASTEAKKAVIKKP